MKKIICLAFVAISTFVSAQSQLPKSGTEISPLLVGEKIPNISVKTIDNSDVKMNTVFDNKRTILVFYRGGWCPYCNLHLAALGEAEKELLDLGYQIVAVSPDAPSSLKTTEEKEKVNYTLLSDSKSELSKAVGLAFLAPANYKSHLEKGSAGVNSNTIPVPSVFIINGDSEIEFEYISPDYKHRISNELLVAAAKALKK